MLNENDFVDDQDDSTTENKSGNVKPIREGQPMGGQKFGENNNTPAGDDRNNPSKNAGYTNEYFRRTEPSEEHPENSNFKVKDQEGAPNYDNAQGSTSSENESNNSNIQATYQEGTADSDGINVNDSSGPDELPGSTNENDADKHLL